MSFPLKIALNVGPEPRVVDIARLAAAAHRQGATVVVDKTFATPINRRPIELGADLVIQVLFAKDTVPSLCAG